MPPCALFFSPDNDNYSFCWTAFKDLSPFCINGFVKLLNPKSLICCFCVATASFQFSILLFEIPLSCDVKFLLMFYFHSSATSLNIYKAHNVQFMITNVEYTLGLSWGQSLFATKWVQFKTHSLFNKSSKTQSS